MARVEEIGSVLWTPPADVRETTQVGRYLDWLKEERGIDHAGYDELWRWSVEDLEGFWGSLWDFFEIRAHTPYERVLGSSEMRKLLAELTDRFTHVIIDTPPVGSFTDGVLASTLVDGVLLVVHSGKTSRGVVRRTKQLLQDVGAKVFGVILNNVNLREHDYYYYRGYYSHSYSSADAAAPEQSASS